MPCCAGTEVAGLRLALLIPSIVYPWQWPVYPAKQSLPLTPSAPSLSTPPRAKPDQTETDAGGK